MFKRFVIVMLVLASVGLAYGESQRPVLTRENALPDKGQLEIGSLFLYQELEESGEALQVNDSDVMTVTPYARIGLLDNLSAHVMVPFKDIDRDMGGDDQGLGDVIVGFELVAFEDIFDYPYVIPHVDVRLNTGDEDDGLGSGESATMLGLSVGTVVEDVVHFIVDATYEILGDSDNIAAFSGTIIWDVSPQFSVLAEAMITDEELVPDDGHPSYYEAGMTYKATDSLALSIYGGGAKNTSEDMNTMGKVSYSF